MTEFPIWITNAATPAPACMISTSDTGFVVGPALKGTIGGDDYALSCTMQGFDVQQFTDDSFRWQQTEMCLGADQIVEPIGSSLPMPTIAGLSQPLHEDTPMTDQEVRLWALDLAYNFLLNFGGSEMKAITGDRLVAQARVFELYVRLASELPDFECSPAESYDYGNGADSTASDDFMSWAAETGETTFTPPDLPEDTKQAERDRLAAKTSSLIEKLRERTTPKVAAPSGRQHAPLPFDPLRRKD
jgi:hypothetical protein